MMWAVKQFWAVARLTALEAIRQPLAFLLFVSALFLVALLPLVLSHTLGESAKFVRDGSLAFTWVTGLILAAHLACASLAGEIRRGTVSTVLSKPLPRALFFLAKYAGILAVMWLFAAGLLMAVLLSARAAREAYIVDWWASVPLWLALGSTFVIGGLINFFLRRPFISNAFVALFLLLSAAFLYVSFIDGQGQPAPFGSLFDWRIVQAGLLIALAVSVLAGISVSLATRLTTIPTLSICAGIFLLGLLSDYLFGRFTATSMWATVLYYLIPNWQHFWVVDALAGDGVVPGIYIARVATYAVLYLTGVLLLGVRAFQHMEVEA